MNRRRLLNRLVALGVSTALCGLACEAGAQQLILKGEYGLMAGTQPPPGLYAGILGGNYSATVSVPWATGTPGSSEGRSRRRAAGSTFSWCCR
jgi:hypothetical protein